MPIQSELNNMGEGVIFIVFIILIIIVLTEIGVAFGMPELTNQLISSLSLGVILILAIPPIGLLTAFVVFIVKILQDSSRL